MSDHVRLFENVSYFCPCKNQRSRFLSAVHGTVAVAKAGNGADNGEIGQVRESEHFGSDADRSEPCIGSTAENGGIAECGGEYRRDTEQRGKCCTKAGTDCKQRCDFAALKSNGKGADGEQQLAQKVEPVNGSAVTGEGDQIGAQSGVSARVRRAGETLPVPNRRGQCESQGWGAAWRHRFFLVSAAG